MLISFIIVFLKTKSTTQVNTPLHFLGIIWGGGHRRRDWEHEASPLQNISCVSNDAVAVCSVIVCPEFYRSNIFVLIECFEETSEPCRELCVAGLACNTVWNVFQAQFQPSLSVPGFLRNRRPGPKVPEMLAIKTHLGKESLGNQS